MLDELKCIPGTCRSGRGTSGNSADTSECKRLCFLFIITLESLCLSRCFIIYKTQAEHYKILLLYGCIQWLTCPIV